MTPPGPLPGFACRVLGALAGLLLLAAWTTAEAGDIQVSASVDNSEITLEDTLKYSITVQGTAQASPPHLPATPDFRVQSQGTSSSLQIINGQRSDSLTFNYTLAPLRLGTFTLSPVTVEVEGRPYVSPPVTVQVKEKIAAPGEVPEVFAEAEVSTLTPYVQQQVTYTLRLFYSREVRNLTLDLPFQGFLKQDLGAPVKYSKSRGGKTYQVYEVAVALFPLKPGALSLPAGMLGIDVVYRDRKGRIFDRLDPFFSDPFFTNVVKTEHKNLRTEPFELTVRPLPSNGRPAGFSGLVGQFTLTSEVSRRELEVGDTTTLTVTASGPGNVQAAALAPPDFGPHFKVYPDQPMLNQKVENRRVIGTRTHTFALVPLQPGTATVPSFTLSFFDPEADAYRQVETEPIRLELRPGPAGETPSESARGTGPRAGNIEAMDLLPIHSGADSFEDTRFTAGDSVRFAAALLAPPLLYLAFAWHLRHRNRLQFDPAYARNRGAFRKARERLDRLAEVPDRERLHVLSLCVRDYLGDKLGFQGAAFTAKEVADQLKDRGLAPEPIAAVQDLLERFETLQYAGPGEAVPQDLVQEAGRILDKLERDLR